MDGSAVASMFGGRPARVLAGTPVAVIGQVNDRMPYMFGDAVVPESAFDFIVDDPRGYHELFSPPNLPITRGRAMPAVITGKAAKALPIRIVKPAMPRQ